MATTPEQQPLLPAQATEKANVDVEASRADTKKAKVPEHVHDQSLVGDATSNIFGGARRLFTKHPFIAAGLAVGAVLLIGLVVFFSCGGGWKGLFGGSSSSSSPDNSPAGAPDRSENHFGAGNGSGNGDGNGSGGSAGEPQHGKEKPDGKEKDASKHEEKKKKISEQEKEGEGKTGKCGEDKPGESKKEGDVEIDVGPRPEHWPAILPWPLYVFNEVKFSGLGAEADSDG